MRTLLVLAQHPDLAESIRAGVDPEHYRVLHRTTLEEAEPLLGHALVAASIVDVELTTVQGIWLLEKLRRRAPKCPIILYTGVRQWEWEEEAYLHGATHVLSKPVRPRMLNTLLDRLWQGPAEERPLGGAEHAPAPEIAKPGPSVAPPLTGAPTLGVLRDFSAILTHSLNAEGMLKQFLLLLRE